IIAHEGVRPNLVEHGEQTLANWRQNPRMAALLSEVTIIPPTVTFQAKALLFIGGIEGPMLSLATALSPSESEAWLPPSMPLFAGDLLFNAIVPALAAGANSAAWVQALERLEQWGAAHAIPGHGPIQTPAALADLRRWFITLRTQVGDALNSGWDRE